MECPECKDELKKMDDLSRAMGNEVFFECPKCGTVVLMSGDKISRVWPFARLPEGGSDKCPLDSDTSVTFQSQNKAAAIVP